MWTRPITVAETAVFIRQAGDVWTDEERSDFVDFIAQNPEAGDLIPETGGVRKVRWSRQGSGKRGGVRVIYFYYRADVPLYLLMVSEGPARGSVAGRETGGAGAGGEDQAGAAPVRREGVMNKFSKELIESMTEACEHAEGKPGRVRVHVVDVPDVRAIRRRLRMSQMEFARTYRIPLATIKNWEQGRRQPDAPAAAYLQVIARKPREAREALTP